MSKEVDLIILCTSIHPNDEVLVDIANKSGFKSFQGSENDKLERYYNAALAYDLDAVIIVDGDDLLCFPEGVDLIAKRLKEGDCDCVSMPGLPVGAASTGITTSSLAKIMEIKDEVDTEVWGGYFFGSGKFNTCELLVNNKLWLHPNIRLTLDYAEDYALLIKIFKEFNNKVNFSSDELMHLIVNVKPEYQQINFGAQKKYLSHLAKAAPVRFKTVTEDLL